MDVIAKLGVGMLVVAAIVAVPVVLNLPQSWLGGVIVLALAANGIILLMYPAKQKPPES